MLLAALRGYGGCEVLAVSNWLLGRDDQLGCLLFAPVDYLEGPRPAFGDVQTRAPSRRAAAVLIAADDPLAVKATTADQAGDLETLKRLLTAQPALATARIGDPECSRSLLHAATDWPGHFPNGRRL